MATVRGAVHMMMETGKACAETLNRIMAVTDLYKIPGSAMVIVVDPTNDVQMVSFGSKTAKSGWIVEDRGCRDEDNWVWRDGSSEYAALSSDDLYRRAEAERKPSEKPLPPDGLWLSAYDDCPAVDYRGLK